MCWLEKAQFRGSGVTDPERTVQPEKPGCAEEQMGEADPLHLPVMHGADSEGSVS